MIKAHCMGMEFPVEVTGYHDFVAMNLNEIVFDPTPDDCERILRESAVPTLGRACDPSAADLDAVAEEQKAKENTSGKTDRRQT